MSSSLINEQHGNACQVAGVYVELHDVMYAFNHHFDSVQKQNERFIPSLISSSRHADVQICFSLLVVSTRRGSKEISLL